MIPKFLKIIFILVLFFFTNQANSKISGNSFNKKELANYLSAIISYDNQKNEQSLTYFNSSKALVKKHENYLKKYIFSLVVNNKIQRAIQEIKVLENNTNSKFFESYLLLTLDSVIKKNFKSSENYLDKLFQYKDKGTYENAIFDTLKIYISTFKNKKLSSHKSSFQNLNLLNDAFLKCYLDDATTINSFDNLVNSPTVDYSRYLFFYANFLLQNQRVDEAKKIFQNQDTINNGLLLLQTKEWLANNEIKKITNIFSCKSETDLLAEFFFLISNLYSTQKDFKKSNFYLSISNFLNNKFTANQLLTVENYYSLEEFTVVKKILQKFREEDQILYWFKVKMNTKIIRSNHNDEQALNYVEDKFKNIKTKSDKILFDMANIYKNFKKYKNAIVLYTKLMKNFDKNSENYADLLFRRGGSNERLGNYLESDKDLLEALKISPDNSYTLNYLAYSWLERKINILKAVEMLETAYKNNEDDPYITDSVGWGYYLIGKYQKAEKFMRKAIMLMPNDPIVNDHYGDILWRLNKRLQAKYYWQSVLNFEDAEEEMKTNIKIKLLIGPEIENNNS